MQFYIRQTKEIVTFNSYEIYENISDQRDDETFDEVVTPFENHSKPQVNRSYETFLFHKMSQRDVETMQQ